MMTYMHADGEGTTRYNSQLDVISAHNKLVGNGQLPDLLAHAEEMVHKFAVADLFGLRLLHKHNDITDGERMVEFEAQRAMRAGATVPVLETVCVKLGNIESPSIWAFARNGMPLPLEYSIRLPVAVIQNAMTERREFVEALAREVYERELQDVIGLCMPNFEFASKHVSPDHGIMIERSDHVRRANVISVEDRRDIDPSNFIPTTWTFGGAFVGCGPTCEIEDDGTHKKVDHVPDDD
jgi:hypothetical protein